MKVITIASPDKISIGMFVDFLRSVLGSSYSVGNLHSLMSSDSLEIYIKDFLNKNKNKALFTYYAKKKINTPPEKVIPRFLIDSSEAVIWFDLYSTEMKIIKDIVQFGDSFASRWKKNVERLNKI